MQTTFELGARQPTTSTAPARMQDKGQIEGILVWVLDRRTSEYVRVYEIGPEQGPDFWVDGEFQGAWTRGNFETFEDARKIATKAFHRLNEGRA